MQSATDTPTTPHPIGPMPPLPAPRGDALPMFTPATPEQAAARFRCEPYRCTMRGEDCAKRHQRAKATADSSLQGSMHACVACVPGAARARLLNAAYKTDALEGRRPYVPPNALGASKATRTRLAAEADGLVNAPCVACGRERPAKIRRRMSDPRRPWCADCVGRATRRLRHLVVKPSAAAVVMVLQGATTDAAVDQALADGCKRAKPKASKKTPQREARPGLAPAAGAASVPDRPTPPPGAKTKGAEPCAKCGRPRRHTRRAADHPLRPFCYDCAQVALSRVRHLAPHITKQSPKGLAILIVSEDVEAALAQARADGAVVRDRQPLGRPRRSRVGSTRGGATTPSPSRQADRPTQPAGHVTEGGGASCPASSPSAAPSSFEPPVADPAFSPLECAGDVVGGSTGGHVPHPAGEPGAACDQEGAPSLSRSPSSPELAAPTAESFRAQPVLPFADLTPTPADLDPPGLGRARLGEHAGSSASGGPAKGPALHGTAKAAQGLLAGIRADYAAALDRVAALEAERARLQSQIRHLTAALALAHEVAGHG